jgi:hypothetical protein
VFCVVAASFPVLQASDFVFENAVYLVGYDFQSGGILFEYRLFAQFVPELGLFEEHRVPHVSIV